MRQPEIILTIAGSDSSGGAGIQADIKTISALGGYAASVITAVTAQNTRGVQAVFPLPASIVREQLFSVFNDLHPGAVKIGMVCNDGLIRAIAEILQQFHPSFIICDPVMVSTSGRRLMSETAIQTIQEELFPLCTLVTPNLHEASLLSGAAITGVNDMEQSGKAFVNRYHANVLIKGGHLSGNNMDDILCLTDGTSCAFTMSKIDSGNLHGTGCTLSSAIATFAAQGSPLEEAVEKAKDYITQAIVNAKDWHIGEGNGPLCHFF